MFDPKENALGTVEAVVVGADGVAINVFDPNTGTELAVVIGVPPNRFVAGLSGFAPPNENAGAVEAEVVVLNIFNVAAAVFGTEVDPNASAGD